MLTSQTLKISKTRNGSGIFANKNFYKGQRLFQITGKLLTLDEDEEVDEKTRDNSFRLDENYYISPEGKIGDFLNHSCNPNSGIFKIKNGLFLKAVRDVKKGEEIVMDYSTILADDDIWEMDCNCGEINCRKGIKRFSSLPTKFKKKYLKSGIVPGYIYRNKTNR
jgi:hypothetical protein